MKVLARVACVVSAVAALLLSYQAAADLYFGSHLGLDNGIGG